MKFQELSYCSFRGRPGSCSRFPGAARLSNGRLVVLYDDGKDSFSAEHDMRIAFSTDSGRSWQDGGVMYDSSALGLAHRFTDSCKPTAIDNDELVSVGYGFIRENPEEGLEEYALKHGGFPESHNTFSFSGDGGKTWKVPSFIGHRFETALELSGPALWCAEEKVLLVFGPPFVLKGHRQQGVVLGSRDRGKTWEQYGTFFDSPSVAPWEVRSLREKSGRIWLVIWAYDFEKQAHLCNQLVYSDDLGRTWSPPLSTGIRGQAANLFIAEGKKHILYTVREGENTGIYCAEFSLESDNALSVGKSVALWSASGMAGAQGERIEKQFRALKFGQPSMTCLGGNEYLLLYWSCEADGYAIRARVLEVSAS